ncbi:hypothetical protein HDV57DRAFT_486579 [Trichoderma longibrachiatum]
MSITVTFMLLTLSPSLTDGVIRNLIFSPREAFPAFIIGFTKPSIFLSSISISLTASSKSPVLPPASRKAERRAASPRTGRGPRAAQRRRAQCQSRQPRDSDGIHVVLRFGEFVCFWRAWRC